MGSADSAVSYDITAMAIQSLAPYSSRTNVKTAVDNALTWMSTNHSRLIADSSEAISQTIVALTELGIDPTLGTRFIQNGKNLLDSLIDYKAGTGFAHEQGGNENDMATEQAAYALVSYERLVNDKKALYDMSDVAFIDPLDEKANLKAAIASAEGLVEADYTTESWQMLSATLMR